MSHYDGDLGSLGTYEIPTNSYEPIYHAEILADGVTAPSICRSVWVGQGGDIQFTMQSGKTAEFHNIDDGTLLPIRATAWTDLGSSVANVLFLY